MGGTEGGGTSGKNFDFFLWSHGHGYVELVVAMRLVLIKMRMKMIIFMSFHGDY